MSWIWSDKPPFLIALFLGAVAWAVTHYTTFLSEVPIVRYELIQGVVGKQQTVDVTLKNLTTKIVFTELEFVIRAERVSGPMIHVTPPAWEGTEAPSLPPEASGSATYKVRNLQPGGRLRLTASITGEPFFYLSKSSQPVYLTTSTPLTFIAERQGTIVAGLIVGMSLVLVGIYLPALLPGSAQRSSDKGQS